VGHNVKWETPTYGTIYPEILRLSDSSSPFCKEPALFISSMCRDKQSRRGELERDLRNQPFAQLECLRQIFRVLFDFTLFIHAPD
jgi:hypothetical protein